MAIIIGGSGNDTLISGGDGDTLMGGDGDDFLDSTFGNDVSEYGENGNDLLKGGDNNDFLDGGDGRDNLKGGEGDDTLMGGNGIDFLDGQDGNDSLNGGDGDDVLHGGFGIDIMVGGSGNDYYKIIDDVGDVVIETSTLTTEIDSVESTFSYALGANVENLTLIYRAVYGTGNGLDNVITGNTVNNLLDGADGNDWLSGGSGIDTMIGGTGNDTYIIDNVGDIVIETSTLATEIDTVQASVSYVLSANLENLTLFGGKNGTGNSLNNVITGNSVNNLLDGGGGNDWLYGGVGIDTMIGGTGNDTYVIDNVGDVVVESSTQETEIDTVQASVSYTLGANLENLTLLGGENGTGNGLANILMGNDIANVLDGGAGADTMLGGLGNDTYVVGNLGDIVKETSTLAIEIDTVQSAISYTLGSNLENLTLTGSAAISGAGNSLNNILIGNSAANSLDGGAGADMMVGGLGNDTYFVGNPGDVVTETSTLATEIDTVQSAISYILGKNLENLTLTGGKVISGSGNSLNNTLTGNGAANSLDGGAGADTMVGGLGNDTYFVGNPGDVVTETSTLLSEIDTVQSVISFTLGNNLENLTLMGSAAVSGTGNSLNNTLMGNTAANSLSGGAGADILSGGVGADTLNGGLGNDTYLYSRGFGADTILDSDATLGNIDMALWGANISRSQIWLSHVGNNLEMSVIGTTDKLVLKNWYSGSAFHIEQFKTADGKQLLDSHVENLVNAMASITPPPFGQTALTIQQHAVLDGAIAANWT